MDRRRLLLVATSLLSTTTLAQSPLERKFTEQVSPTRMQKTVHDLVRFAPRTGGTKHGDMSAEYVLRMFQERGLDAEVIEEQERLTFTHEGWLLKVEQPPSLVGLIKHEWLAGFSPDVNLKTARLVYAGGGRYVEEGMYKGLIVLTERHVDPEFYSRLVKSGAVCVLSYAPAVEGRYSDWAFISDLRPSRENAIPLFNISFNNGTTLRQELERGSSIVLSFTTKTVVGPGSPKTVVATLRGVSDEYYIVCAHGDSDSGGPGADDNASGVAGVLELARTLHKLVQSNILPPPKKTIKFIVWGSEYYSTHHFLMRQADTLTKILGVLNYDEIGTGATRNCLYFESNDVQHNEALLRTFNSIAEEYVGKEGFWEEATTNPSQGGTDSYLFLPEYLERANLPAVLIPSVTIYSAAWDKTVTYPQTKGWSSKAWNGDPDSVTVDYSRYYHSSLDIPSLTTDAEPFNMVWAVKAVGIALLRLAW